MSQMSSPVVIRLEILNLDLLNELASVGQMESRNEQHSTIDHLTFSKMKPLMFMLLIFLVYTNITIYSTLPIRLSRMIIIPILLVLQYLVAIYQGVVFPIG